MQQRHQTLAQNEEIFLINTQQPRSDGHGRVAEEWEETTAVDQEVREETLGSNAVEYGNVDIQGLEVDSGGQVGMEALGETLTDSQLQRDNGILHVGQQDLCVCVGGMCDMGVCVYTCRCVCVHV